MQAASGKDQILKSRSAANDNGRTHPAWRRAVAGGMVIVFTLTLCVVGLMLCAGTIGAP